MISAWWVAIITGMGIWGRFHEVEGQSCDISSRALAVEYKYSKNQLR